MIEKEWTYNGFPCVVRVVEGLGHRCGYVGIPKGHPYFCKKDTDAYGLPLEVHGGITYSKGGLEEETPDTWWIGFDCLHDGDSPDPKYAPDDLPLFWTNGQVWTLPMVIAETENLADQLKAAE